MSNHEIVGKGFGILREQLAPYIAQQLLNIPEYQLEDRWWTEGVLGVLNDREQNDLYYGDDYGMRVDSLDIAACLDIHFFIDQLNRRCRLFFCFCAGCCQDHGKRQNE